MTVAELEARMTRSELVEWMAYDSLAPIGERRADLRAGIIAATLANVHRGKQQKPLAPTAFMPFEPEPPRDPKAEEARLRAGFAALKERQRRG